MTLRIKVQHKRSKVKKKKKKIQIQIQVDETFEGIESDQGLQIISNRRAKKFTDIGKSEKGARWCESNTVRSIRPYGRDLQDSNLK